MTRTVIYIFQLKGGDMDRCKVLIKLVIKSALQGERIP